LLPHSFQSEIFGKAHHHDISETEPGNHYFNDVASVGRKCFALVEVAQANVRLVTDGGELGGNSSEPGFIFPVNQVYFFALEIHG
jgi:hypothetical protein